MLNPWMTELFVPPFPIIVHIPLHTE